eukprot:snap_masked-scaffold_4-processed-gene-20.14-mRNA-1 protein AED:1.00 eAED:1.00 QI:0/-1/0/0/-1/1/1/0/427
MVNSRRLRVMKEILRFGIIFTNLENLFIDELRLLIAFFQSSSKFQITQILLQGRHERRDKLQAKGVRVDSGLSFEKNYKDVFGAISVRLRLAKYCDLQELSLKALELRLSAVKLLAQSLKVTSINRFEAVSCRLGDKKAKMLLNALKENRSVEWLNFSDNLLTDESSSNLVACLRTRAQKVLETQWKENLREVQNLTPSLPTKSQKNLLVLDLSQNRFGKQLLTSLSDYLRNYRGLQALNLKGVFFDGKSLKSFGSALVKTETSLQVLALVKKESVFTKGKLQLDLHRKLEHLVHEKFKVSARKMSKLLRIEVHERWKIDHEFNHEAKLSSSQNTLKSFDEVYDLSKEIENQFRLDTGHVNEPCKQRKRKVLLRKKNQASRGRRSGNKENICPRTKTSSVDEELNKILDKLESTLQGLNKTLSARGS